jgi:hypothetical protein
MAMLYLGSFFLPPMGIIWGYKYIKQKDTVSRIHGVILIFGTIILLIVLVQITVTTVNTINEQVYKQLNGLGY